MCLGRGTPAKEFESRQTERGMLDAMQTFAKQRKVPLRLAASAVGIQRVADTKDLRGLFP